MGYRPFSGEDATFWTIVTWDDKSNANYVNPNSEVVPEALPTLKDLVGLVKAERSEQWGGNSLFWGERVSGGLSR